MKWVVVAFVLGIVGAVLDHWVIRPWLKRKAEIRATEDAKRWLEEHWNPPIKALLKRGDVPLCVWNHIGGDALLKVMQDLPKEAGHPMLPDLIWQLWDYAIKMRMSRETQANKTRKNQRDSDMIMCFVQQVEAAKREAASAQLDQLLEECRDDIDELHRQDALRNEMEVQQAINILSNTPKKPQPPRSI